MGRTANSTPEKDWKPIFLQELARTGNVSTAAKKAKIGRRTAYGARLSDEVFAEAWKECLDIAVELLEEEARRRAAEGCDRPVYQGGKLVGKVREYSDVLLIFLLKAHRPDKYRENSRVVVAGDASAPVKHDHTITGRIDKLASAFEGAADRAGEGAVSGDGS